MKAVRSNLPKLARVPLDIGGQFTSWSFVFFAVSPQLQGGHYSLSFIKSLFVNSQPYTYFVRNQPSLLLVVFCIFIDDSSCWFLLTIPIFASVKFSKMFKLKNNSVCVNLVQFSLNTLIMLNNRLF